MFHSDVVTNKLQYFSSLRVRQFISCTHRVAVMSTNTMRTMLLGVLIIIKAYSSYFISLFGLFYWICFTFLIAPEILIINTFHINFNYFFLYISSTVSLHFTSGLSKLNYPFSIYFLTLYLCLYCYFNLNVFIQSSHAITASHTQMF